MIPLCQLRLQEVKKGSNCLAGNQQRLKKENRLGIHGDCLIDVVNERVSQLSVKEEIYLSLPAEQQQKKGKKERGH